MKKIIHRHAENLRVIFDCRKTIRNARKRGFHVNTEFLAYIASIPEWTITIFNKP